MSDKTVFVSGEIVEEDDAPGPTLRDRFAMAALTGASANPDISEAMSKVAMTGDERREAYAKSAFKMADAMLESRKLSSREPSGEVGR